MTHLGGRIRAIPREVYEHTTDRVMPQGAGELAHALHSGSAYLPYGPGQRAIEIEQSRGVYGPQQRSEGQQQPVQDRDGGRSLEM